MWRFYLCYPYRYKNIYSKMHFPYIRPLNELLIHKLTIVTHPEYIHKLVRTYTNWSRTWHWIVAGFRMPCQPSNQPTSSNWFPWNSIFAPGDLPQIQQSDYLLTPSFTGELSPHDQKARGTTTMLAYAAYFFEYDIWLCKLSIDIHRHKDNRSAIWFSAIESPQWCYLTASQGVSTQKLLSE